MKKKWWIKLNQYTDLSRQDCNLLHKLKCNVCSSYW